MPVSKLPFVNDAHADEPEKLNRIANMITNLFTFFIIFSPYCDVITILSFLNTVIINEIHRNQFKIFKAGLLSLLTCNIAYINILSDYCQDKR